MGWMWPLWTTTNSLVWARSARSPSGIWGRRTRKLSSSPVPIVERLTSSTQSVLAGRTSILRQAAKQAFYVFTNFRQATSWPNARHTRVQSRAWLSPKTTSRSYRRGVTGLSQFGISICLEMKHHTHTHKVIDKHYWLPYLFSKLDRKATKRDSM